MGEMSARGRWVSSAARAFVVAGALVMPVAAAGCGADDRAMRPPSEAQTTTSRPSSPATSPTTASGFTLQSDMFAETGLIPDRYTCRGAGSRPPLRWTGLPDDTVELAVVVRDLDAGGFVHWVVAGIEPGVTELVEGALPVSAIEAGNGAGGQGWTAPCPPSGTHRYEFKVYALALPSELEADLPAHQAAPLVEGASARGTAALTGTVSAAS
jgi:Raf kinase inhibitor-like YbhB/YbcL family protein